MITGIQNINLPILGYLEPALNSKMIRVWIAGAMALTCFYIIKSLCNRVLTRWGQEELKLAHSSCIKHQYDQAIQHYRTAIPYFEKKQRAEAILDRGRLFLIRGNDNVDYRAAVIDFTDSILNKDLEDSLKVEALLKRGEAYLNMNDFSAALADFNALLNSKLVDGVRREALLNRGRTLYKMNHHGQALEDFNLGLKSLDLPPQQAAKFLLQRSIVLYFQKKTQEAVQDLTLALKNCKFADPDTRKAISYGLFSIHAKGQMEISQAQTSLAQKQFDKAIRHYTAAIPCLVEKQAAETKIERAEVFLTRGNDISDYEAAVQDFTDSIACKDLEPQLRIEILFKRGEAYLKMNNFPSALEDFNAFLESTKDHELRATALRYQTEILQNWKSN